MDESLEDMNSQEDVMMIYIRMMPASDDEDDEAHIAEDRADDRLLLCHATRL